MISYKAAIPAPYSPTGCPLSDMQATIRHCVRGKALCFQNQAILPDDLSQDPKLQSPPSLKVCYHIFHVLIAMGFSIGRLLQEIQHQGEPHFISVFIAAFPLNMKQIFANPVGIQIDQLKALLPQNPVQIQTFLS